MPKRDTARTVRRSRTRRAGESAFGLLLLARLVVMGTVACLLLCAGVWASWHSAGPAMAGDTRGTVRIDTCGDDRCWGPFTPSDGDPGARRAKVTLTERVVPADRAEPLAVALRPGTDEAVRTGPAGVLYAWVPLGGALLLASLVVAGGMRMRRAALGLGLTGAAVMGGAWALLTF